MYQDNYYPFYMNFQNPGFWDEERMMERENQLMRSFYPRTARRVQEKVEAECDRMDYPGSFIYDEYPDKFMLEQVCRRVRMKLDDDELLEERFPVSEDMAMRFPLQDEMESEERGRDNRRDDRRGRREDGLLDELIHVLLFQEMRRRRCRNNRCRRFF